MFISPRVGEAWSENAGAFCVLANAGIYRELYTGIVQGSTSPRMVACSEFSGSDLSCECHVLRARQLLKFTEPASRNASR